MFFDVEESFETYILSHFFGKSPLWQYARKDHFEGHFRHFSRITTLMLL